MRIFSPLLVSCVLLTLGLTGCGPGSGADKTPLAPVSGTVKLDGAPAADVGVMFFPVGSTPGSRTYYGSTDQSGRYELSAGGAQKGAPVGEYKVTCSKFLKPDGSPFKSDGQSPELAGAKESIPPRYSDQSQTELKATVKDGGATIDLELKSK